jgi:hypothetical protein
MLFEFLRQNIFKSYARFLYMRVGVYLYALGLGLKKTLTTTNLCPVNRLITIPKGILIIRNYKCIHCIPTFIGFPKKIRTDFKKKNTPDLM